MRDLDSFLNSPLADYATTFLIVVSVIGVTFTLLMPLFSNDKLGKRKDSLVERTNVQLSGGSKKLDGTARRKSVQDQLKVMEEQQAAKKRMQISLFLRIG